MFRDRLSHHRSAKLLSRVLLEYEDQPMSPMPSRCLILICILLNIIEHSAEVVDDGGDFFQQGKQEDDERARHQLFREYSPPIVVSSTTYCVKLFSFKVTRHRYLNLKHRHYVLYTTNGSEVDPTTICLTADCRDHSCCSRSLPLEV